MTTITQERPTASFLVSEGNGHRSREAVTVDATGAALSAGALLGKVTASGVYVRHDTDATDGSQTVAGILYEGIAADATERRTAIVRDAEVNGAHLTYEDGADAAAITAANTALASLGIFVR